MRNTIDDDDIETAILGDRVGRQIKTQSGRALSPQCGDWVDERFVNRHELTRGVQYLDMNVLAQRAPW